MQLGANGTKAVYPINDIANRQLGTYTNIPATYYDRMRAEAPQLLAENLNHWLQHTNEKRMVRTLDGRMRALLSDRYRPLENMDLAEAVLPVILGGEFNVLSCEVTESRLYIKAVDKKINLDIPHGHKMGDGSHKFFDTVSPAIIISNSEVGMGALSVETGIWTHLCTNMAIAKQRSMRKYHVGAKHDMAEGIYELLSDKTKQKTDEAMFLQVRDVVGAAFERVKFEALVKTVKEMAEQPIEGDPIQVVNLAATRFGINDAERGQVLKHFINGGDLSRYGLFNAITRTAEDLESYDRATEFERLGGDIIELPPHDWKEISAAA
jgi:hypothetical protein